MGPRLYIAKIREPVKGMCDNLGSKGGMDVTKSF